MENKRNYFIAIALSVLIVLGWQFFYMNPRLEAQRQAEQAAKLQQQSQQAQQTQTTAAGGTVNGSLPAGGQTAQTVLTRDQSVEKTASSRVVIDTPALAGSINLEGARLDDLRLKSYHETVDKSSPIITLFSPADTKDGYFTELGYVGNDATGAVPGPSTVWKLASGDKLTDKTPVTLSYTNDKGVTFSRTISVDDRYMFTIADKIANSSQAPVSLSSYGRVTRYNKPETPSAYVLHEGFIGVIGDDGLIETKYAATEKEATTPAKSTGGWLGMTDKYWAATIVPPQSTDRKSVV